MIISTARPGINLDQIKKIILDEIKTICINCNRQRIEKSKNGIKAQFVFAMQNLDTVADYLNHYKLSFE
jgi:hypothetical protein